MAITATAPLQSVPSGAVSLDLTPGGTWTYGPYVEFIAAASAATQIAGVTLGSMNGATYSNKQLEIELAVGAAGSEVGIGVYRVYLGNSGNGGPSAFLFPSPLDAVPVGARVAARIRYGDVASDPIAVSLLYYEGLTTSNLSTAPLTCAPLGATAPTLTPNGTAWANSAWVELHSGIGHQIAAVGLAVAQPLAADYEFDLGMGAVGSEVVLTTLRTARSFSSSLGRIMNVLWPAACPIPENQRIAVRMRTSATLANPSLTDISVALLYYDSLVPTTPTVAYTTTNTGLRRLRRSPHLTADLTRLFIARLQLHLQAGLGNSGTASDPQVMLRVSKDGGRTWGPEIQMSAGAVGAYTTRVIAHRLGAGRDWVFEVTVSDDAVPWALLAAYADVLPGTH